MRPSFAVLLIAVATASAEAQIRTFPYEAVTATDEVYVRSGPGQKYYPTGKLPAGSRVTVHRHDPGGWSMITPPEGSFSWIRAQYVHRAGGHRGELTENDVVVRVGSAFGEVRDVEQRRLAKGDVVEILGEATLDSDQGRVKMYRIAPPRGEYRWVSGRDVVPADESHRRTHDRDPFAVPSNAKREPASGTPTIAASPKSGNSPVRTRPSETDAAHPSGSSGSSGPSMERGAATDSQLHAIDLRFRDMIREDARTWDLDGLSAAYEQLQSQASHPAIASQIEQRLEAVQRYRDIQREFDEFVRLTTDTDRRDSQLLSMTRTMRPVSQPGPGPELPPIPVPSDDSTTPPAGVAGPPRNQPSYPTLEPRIQPSPTPEPPPIGGPRLAPTPATPRPPSATVVPPSNRSWTQPGSPAPGMPPRFTTPAPTSRPPYAGAGIIQRAVNRGPGIPLHVLVAPGGRILAYLFGEPGVRLDQNIGRAMGLMGERSYRQDLQADMIRVRSMVPIRLQGEAPAPTQVDGP